MGNTDGMIQGPSTDTFLGCRQEEKNMKKEYVYICITESLCCIPETNTIVVQLYFS